MTRLRLDLVSLGGHTPSVLSVPNPAESHSARSSPLDKPVSKIAHRAVAWACNLFFQTPANSAPPSNPIMEQVVHARQELHAS